MTQQEIAQRILDLAQQFEDGLITKAEYYSKVSVNAEQLATKVLTNQK